MVMICTILRANLISSVKCVVYEHGLCVVVISIYGHSEYANLLRQSMLNILQHGLLFQL